MKMNRIMGSLSIFMAACFAVPAYSQQLDVPAFVELAMKGTDIANRCSSMTDNFLKVRVPADHANARTLAAAHKMVPHAGPAPISAENAEYLKQVESFKLLLSNCGKQFHAVRAQIQTNENRLYGLIDKDTMPRADAQKVATAVKAYNEAHEKLVHSILALSNDKQVESHLHEVITRDFIDEAKKADEGKKGPH